MKTTVTVSIPTPCNERWAAMATVDPIHRHCDSCNKVLTDFSGMSDTELVLWLKHSNGKVCGRFSPAQLNRAMTLPTDQPKKKHWLNALWLLPLSWAGKEAQAQTTPEVIRSKPPVSVITTQPPATAPVESKTTGTIKVTGTVTDEHTNEAIPFCNIYFVHNGQSIATQTDVNGNYTLTLPEGTADIVQITFSVIGYRRQTETISCNQASKGQITLNVKFAQEEIMMKGDMIITYQMPESETKRDESSFWNKTRLALSFGKNKE